MPDKWTKEESDKALKHIETANYELGVLIENVGKLHGDIKLIKHTIHEEIKPSIIELKTKVDDNSDKLTQLEKDTANHSKTLNAIDKIKWLFIGAAFTVAAAVMVFIITKNL